MHDNNNQNTHAKSRKNNVTNIKSTDNPQDKKKNYRGIHYQVVQAMLGNPGRLPEFPEILHRWVDHQGHSIVYTQSDDRVVRQVTNDHVDYLINGYWTYCDNNLDVFWGKVSPQDVEKIRKLWRSSCPPTHGNWTPLAWKSDPGLTLHRMSFDPIREITYDSFEQWCPAYYDFMMRVTNHKTLMAWIGSLFDPLSQRQQYVWIHGPGGDGKSAVLRALMKALGHAASSEEPPGANDKFWAYGLRHKRFIVFADCNNINFVTSGRFKSITGEDKIRVEGKGKDVFTDTLDCKVMLSSNEKPNIPGKKADLRRILFFRTSEITKDFGPTYEDMLTDEIEFFLSICWDLYMEATGGYQHMDRNPRKMLKCEDESEINEIVDESENEYDIFATEVIKVLGLDPNKKDNQQEFITRRDMRDLMAAQGYRQEYERKKLRAYLERKYGLRERFIKINGESSRVFLGCVQLFESKNNSMKS